MLPTEAMPAMRATPKASPMKPRPSDGPSEKRFASLATVIAVAPMKVRMKVPYASASMTLESGRSILCVPRLDFVI